MAAWRGPAPKRTLVGKFQFETGLHLVGPLPFDNDDKGMVSAGPKQWDELDWWLHPGWRDFRDAMSRDRCIYFAEDAERDATEAPFRANSVLVLGTEDGGLPDRIREKYPNRIYRLPRAPRKRKPDQASSAKVLLELAGNVLAERQKPAASAKPDKPLRYGRGRGAPRS